MMIPKKQKPTIFMLLTVLLITTIAVGCTFTGAKKDEETSSEFTLKAEDEKTSSVSTQQEQEEDEKTSLVFTRPDEVTSIEVWSEPDDAGNKTTVSEEFFDEMLEWVSAFSLGKVQKDTDSSKTGTNTFSVMLTYADGSTDSSGIDIAVRDGVSYYIVRPDFPECWNELWDSNELNGDASPATVEITEVTDELLQQYADYDEFDASTDEYGIKLLLTTNSTLRKLRLFSLTWDEAAQDIVEAGDGALYQQNELTPEKPLVIWVSIPGALPTVGIEFIDTDGTTRSYHIIMNGMDGSMELQEAPLTTE